MFKNIARLVAVTVFIGFTAVANAGVIYNIESVLNIGGTDYYGAGFVDVNQSALTASNTITFDSGDILDFSFSFDDVTVTSADIYSPSTEGFATDASGDIVLFADTLYSFADFWAAPDYSRGVFFYDVWAGFRARSALTGGELVRGGTYSITKAGEIPEPISFALLAMGFAGLTLSRRKS